jgi:hypothetical protein
MRRRLTRLADSSASSPTAPLTTPTEIWLPLRFQGGDRPVGRIEFAGFTMQALRSRSSGPVPMPAGSARSPLFSATRRPGAQFSDGIYFQK